MIAQPEAGPGGWGSIVSASWSPDGSRLAYWTYEGVEGVYILDLATGQGDVRGGLSHGWVCVVAASSVAAVVGQPHALRRGLLRTSLSGSIPPRFLGRPWPRARAVRPASASPLPKDATRTPSWLWRAGFG